ncbi:hypothetical protein EON67_09165 [archaeon]|nr:MAG: hypothetical protein EON67_09165 [archaeon]
MQIISTIPSSGLQWVMTVVSTLLSSIFVYKCVYAQVLASAHNGSSGSSAASANSQLSAASGTPRVSAKLITAAIVGVQLTFGIVLKLFFY